jgi:uncharacterized membrane protein
MKSTANVVEHPIHPMLIPYPFAFLSGALGFRLAAAARGNDSFDQTANHLRAAGIASAVVAAIPGIVDYFTVVPAGAARQKATVHALSNSGALACFAAAAIASRGGDEARRRVLGLESVGTMLLSVGGWLGGSLSYHHHIGVVEGTATEELRRPS